MEQNPKQVWKPGFNCGVVLAAIILLMLIISGVWILFMPASGDEIPMTQLTSEEINLARQLEADVSTLAEEIGERNMHTAGTMNRTVSWIEKRMKDSGYNPERQSYKIEGFRYSGQTADNLIAEVEGTQQPNKFVVVGAHYDSVSGSPGANDNASAVAVLLALAEYFADRPQPQTLRFVAFANEEPPFFLSRQMGSYAYARHSSNLGEDITAMMAMDGLGYYRDEPGSQSYPVPGIGFFYPDTADFIGFVTRIRDTGLVRRALGAFREGATFPSEGAALPGFVPGVYWSDHWSFWKHGYPAFLVTDTLLFRDPEYHAPGDTPERLDYHRMARVAGGLKYVVKELANTQ